MVCDREWRGIGAIPRSGFGCGRSSRVRRRAALRRGRRSRRRSCRCASADSILRGLKKPHHCPAFGTRCTPRAPARGADGLVGGRLRGLLPLRPSCRSPRRHAGEACMNALRLTAACPAPLHRVSACAAGTRRRRTHGADLIERMFLPAFANPALDQLHDGAVRQRRADAAGLHTDSFVVSPLCFPGGDIGSLAVHGTVNDSRCAAPAARPLRRLHPRRRAADGRAPADRRSMRAAAAAAGCRSSPATRRWSTAGRATASSSTPPGSGWFREGVDVAPATGAAGRPRVSVRPLGDHGIAVIAARADLEFATAAAPSDSAPVVGPRIGPCSMPSPARTSCGIRRGAVSLPCCARSPWHRASESGSRKPAVPVRPQVQGGCELLGVRTRCTWPARDDSSPPSPRRTPARPLAALHACPGGAPARRMGTWWPRIPVASSCTRGLGSHRLLERLSGEQLPRIC